MGLDIDGPPVRVLHKLAALGAMLLVLFAALFGVYSWHESRAAQLRQLETVMRLTERGVDGYLVHTEATLRDLARSIFEADGFENREASRVLLMRYAAMLPSAIGLSLVALDGQVLASSTTQSLSGLPNLSDNPRFNEFVASIEPETTFELSRPMWGHYSKAWILPIHYVLRKGDRPAALLVLSLPVTLLQSFWADASAVSRSIVGLLADRGYLLSRYPTPVATGPEAVYSDRKGAFQAHLQSENFPAGGVFEGVSEQSGREVVYSYMRLQHFPATLFVAMPSRNFLVAWLRRVEVPYALCALLALFGALAMRFFARQHASNEAQRARAQQALREREREQRFLLDNIVAGVIVYDPDLKTISVNPRAREILRMEGDHHVEHLNDAKSWTILREDGHDISPNIGPLADVVASRKAQHDIVIGYRLEPDSEAVWVLVDMDPVLADDGSLERVVTSFVDITTLKRTEQTLERSEQRFRLLVENSQQPIIKMSGDGRILSANPAAQSQLGLSIEQLMQRGRDGVLASDDPRSAAVIAARQRDGHAVADVTLIRGDGSRFEANISSSEYIDEHGEVVCSVTFHDLTDRRRVAAALAAQRDAENANRAKSRFLAHMSHELRTPLNAILGFSDVLGLDQRHPLEPRQREQVRHIHRAGEHLLAMINDLLDLSRVESGAVKLAPSAVDVLETIEQVARDFAPMARAAQVELIVKRPTRPIGRILADPTRLRQVVANLVSNAIKYNRAGGKASIALDGDALRRRLTLTVRDTGIGMAPEQIERLFAPFDRLGREDTGIEGTGIGMVIVKGLIDLMGGELRVSSAADAGSEFVVELPWVAAGERAARASPMPARIDPAERPPTTPRLPAPEPGVGLVPCRVLYIDDDPINRLLVESLLSMRDDVVLSSAADGRHGLDIARRERPHLVLVDMVMPTMSGKQVLQAIRADAAIAQTRCIAVSASAMPEEIDAALQAGFDGYLTKPLPAAALLPEIDRARASLASTGGGP